MRQLDDDEFDDLQLLARAFCKEHGLNFKAYVAAVGDHIVTCERDHLDPKAAEEKRQRAEETVSRFVMGNTNRGIQVYVKPMVDVLIAMARNHNNSAAVMYFDILTRFFETAKYAGLDGAFLFLEQRRKHMTKGRLSRIDQRRGETGKGLSSNLGRTLLLAAENFEGLGHDVNIMDARIGESRFVCVRPSTKEHGRFIVHGLRFAPHQGDPARYYFSEKYFVANLNQKFIGRKSMGICFVDNGILTGIARAVNGQSFTFLQGKLPAMTQIDSPLDTFDALILTANGQNHNLGSTALCLRCESKADKHSKTGAFSTRELLSLFDVEQAEHLKKWMRSIAQIKDGYVML